MPPSFPGRLPRKRGVIDGPSAIDGSIGKVDHASYETGSSAIVVDTGPWIFGKKVMLPAGVIDRIDHEAEKVYVHRRRTRSRARPSTTTRWRTTIPTAMCLAGTTGRAGWGSASSTIGRGRSDSPAVRMVGRGRGRSLPLPGVVAQVAVVADR
jgi:hypothetical protein